MQRCQFDQHDRRDLSALAGQRQQGVVGIPHHVDLVWALIEDDIHIQLTHCIDHPGYSSHGVDPHSVDLHELLNTLSRDDPDEALGFPIPLNCAPDGPVQPQLETAHPNHEGAKLGNPSLLQQVDRPPGLVLQPLADQGRVWPEVLDLVFGVLEKLKLTLHIGNARLIIKRHLEALLVDHNSIGSDGLSTSEFHISKSPVLSCNPSRIEFVQSLRTTLVDFVLGTPKISYETIAITLVIDKARLHEVFADLLTLLIVEITPSLLQFYAAREQAPTPPTLMLVPEINHPDLTGFFLPVGVHEPLVLAVGRGGEVFPRVHRVFKLVRLVRREGLDLLKIHPLGNATKPGVTEIMFE